MKPKMKTYEVNVDYRCSFDYTVRARTTGEAKKKAWDKHKKDRSKRKWASFLVGRLED